MNTSPVKILLVDDNERNLLALEALLQTLQANCVKVTSGKAALKCLLDQEFALILLDVKMPEMDGFETAAIIRTREKNKETPIIFITAYHPTETNIFQGYAVGAVDYIVKPIVPEILLSKVKVFSQLFQQNSTLKILNQQLTNANLALQSEIKERLEAERQLQLLTNELKRSNQELEQFAYIASHDLQEPLGTMMGFADLLVKQAQEKLDDKTYQYIGCIVNSSNRMHQLIQDLLTYSRVGRNELNLQPIDCNAIINQVLDNLQGTINKTSGQITCDFLPTIMADSGQISQLFQNLISNAIKYHGEEPPKVHISASFQAQEWLFSVKDNGIGIDSKYAEKIFVIFQRLHSSDEYPGTGIGLALCKKISQRHQGRIWLESELGKGTTFYFTLPFLPTQIKTVMGQNSDYPLNIKLIKSKILETTEEDLNNVKLMTVKPCDLDVMSPEWVLQLHEAAIALDEQKFMELIEQIPENYQTLADSLRDLIENFHWDILFELTKSKL